MQRPAFDHLEMTGNKNYTSRAAARNVMNPHATYSPRPVTQSQIVAQPIKGGNEVRDSEPSFGFKIEPIPEDFTKSFEPKDSKTKSPNTTSLQKNKQARTRLQDS